MVSAWSESFNMIFRCLGNAKNECYWLGRDIIFVFLLSTIQISTDIVFVVVVVVVIFVIFRLSAKIARSAKRSEA